MPKESGRLVPEVLVTPRFEIFYALQALESGAGTHLRQWRREMERRLPARLRTSLAGVAPVALMWPLLADALRDETPTIEFPQMMDALRGMDERGFQRSVLAGAFKLPGSVDGLMSGKVSLTRTVETESVAQERILTLLGLYPFHRSSASASAFERLVSEPAAFRDEVVLVIEGFWKAGFSNSWATLEPQMRKSSRAMRHQLARETFSKFSGVRNLPVTMDDTAVVTVRGGARSPLKSVAALYLIPSAFNTARLWASYSDSHKRKRFFIPVLDPDLWPDSSAQVDPSAVFKALGDTTRYAIASMLARNSMTSVELARAFDVSKPTISHHVQQLRAAGLLEEDQSDSGVVLSLNRRVLEKASQAAAHEMFSEDGPAVEAKRTRRANKS
ncbi:MAG: metalloregulator ArsR/SmtB family transcription factor [Gemmatimonadales bacterium]